MSPLKRVQFQNPQGRVQKFTESSDAELSWHAYHTYLLLFGRPCKKPNVLFNVFNYSEMHCVGRLTRDGIGFHRQEGFMVGNARHGRRFGTGVYLAEDLQKSLSYCSSSDGTNYVLLCRSCHQMKVPACSHKNSESHSLSSPGHDVCVFLNNAAWESSGLHA